MFKKLALSAVVALSVFSVTTSAFADSYSRTSSGSSQNFSASWMLEDPRGSGTTYRNLQFGYNKFAIDEDVAKTYSQSTSHTATITNTNGTYNQNTSAGSWTNLQVRHAGNNVTYIITY